MQEARVLTLFLWKARLVQTNFFNVVGDRGLNETPQRFCACCRLPDRGRGNRLVDPIEQMNRHPAKHQITGGSLFCKRLRGLRARTKTFRQSIRHVGEGLTRPACHHKLALTKQSLRLMPLGNIGKGVNANQQKEAVCLLEGLL
jgi:hypothetical protein